MKSEPTESAVNRTMAEQACRDLVVKAAMLTDAQDHEGFAALFTEGGLLVRPGQPLQGRAAIIDSYRARSAQARQVVGEFADRFALTGGYAGARLGSFCAGSTPFELRWLSRAVWAITVASQKSLRSVTRGALLANERRNHSAKATL